MPGLHEDIYTPANKKCALSNRAIKPLSHFKELVPAFLYDLHAGRATDTGSAGIYQFFCKSI